MHSEHNEDFLFSFRWVGGYVSKDLLIILYTIFKKIKAHISF